ncbi:DUF362 domain-containing protein [Synechococcus elongatus]|uniref:DUF362 domain-containing protein n=2 Tax=Synechococcus elongatus TaxID=32046 RepID=Q31NP0_SYNE7|nr:DUF362 domain-containing protein [Synechococcus elongatus]ABB57329.1 conserved hypothetical protein [Synechococcus elongatus PCC 7942 = FACHB-805]AJD58160.1 Thylakoid-associated protein [Synechococcus elongatus UTEX 2973]MBD2587736.1 DUF362 domain-containing protein [Synechococcus elongatus FACHB-242]MBD2688485.1 DUF362 domain-containing protein [Synechococcus elongatus FACHB-1061]MBD2707556.1 DUF362 domain-containing protein [Synechococcus elongatus PCC 7942 = FACHB-805]
MSPTVALLRVDRYEAQLLDERLAALLAPWGGMAAFVKPGQKVLLKPNLLTGNRPGKECVTRPDLVAAIARLVRQVGGEPFLGDSPAFGSAKGVAIASGYGPMLEELDIPLVEFRGVRQSTDSPTFQHLRLSREALGADVVINIPKLKSHVQLTLSAGVKNLFGCVPGKMKAWWHLEAGKDRDRFGEMLVETARAISPALTILDAIVAHEGNGPSNGEPRSLKLLAAADDVFALDQACATLLGLNELAVPTLAAAARLQLQHPTLHYPFLDAGDCRILDWRQPDRLVPIDFGAPRILRSTLKHLYIRLIKEPFQAYARSSS